MSSTSWGEAGGIPFLAPGNAVAREIIGMTAMFRITERGTFQKLPPETGFLEFLDSLPDDLER